MKNKLLLFCFLFQVKCDCESLKEFVALVDFEHLVPRDHMLERGAVLFRKEFYDTGLCVDAQGQEMSLKAFARDWVVVVEPGEMRVTRDSAESSSTSSLLVEPDRISNRCNFRKVV